MPTMVGGPVGGGPMPMMNNVLAAQVQRPDGNNRTNLNTYIYDYFLRERMYECARALLNSSGTLNVIKDSPGRRSDENGNGLGNGLGDDTMDTDSKDDSDSKTRPDNLPAPDLPNGSDSCFLYEWFCLFWDMMSAQRNKSGIPPQVGQYVNHTQHLQQQSRLRQSQQQEMLRNMRQDMYGGNPMMRSMQNGMQMNAKPTNLARTAMANNQNNPQAMQMLQAAKQNQIQMQRDGSNMDGNPNRPVSPGSADNAPSPSKRPRLDGSGPFNPQQPNMMNGQRPQQGMPGQQVGNTRAAAIAQHMLTTNGIDPANLSPQQFQHFQTQPPQAQASSINAYSQTLKQHHGQQMPNKQVPNPGVPQQGSPMMATGPDGAAALGAFYNANDMAQGGMRAAGPGAVAQGGGSNHALQDYQMQLMLLEQQNKKRLMMARQEQDSMGGIREGGGPGPGGPPGPPGPNGQPFQDTSPQARPGASPNPSEQMKRTPQMNPAGIPSPLPEGGQSRGSPNAMNFMQNGMDPNMQHQFFKGMNGMDGNMVPAPQMNGMRPPNSHPNQPFNGQMNPQMMARQQQGPQGVPQQMQWQGPNGNGMAPQGPQGPQGPVQNTPQQRSMPPPSAPAPAGNTNGRTTQSPQQTNAAPPTPQQSNKAAPKKKDTSKAKSKAAAQKKTQNAGATPVAEATQETEPPAPATPITPVIPGGFKQGQNPGGAQPPANAATSAPPPAPAPVAVPQPDPSQMNFSSMNDGGAIDFGMDFANPLTTDNVLQDFDFDSFLHDGDGDPTAFDFTSTNFGMEGAGEIGAE
ncbi:Uu.00g103900.m01.CDS01 [Anthostomella pinea]|uniref:Uu.00g103900.m01.CDS01 n=1 Tax=Anthostomella pinea TaxID=933095 RepID=A0AAI8YD85_9PEZI|nr:Uu.00g103900.m01.CDS01 [Anthostomella pinea]